MPDCVFCKIVKGELSATVLYRDNDLIVIKDIAPKAPVHWLFIPTVHIESLTQTDDTHQQLLGTLFLIARTKAAHAGLADRGYRLIMNNGPDAHQEVPHLHLHLLGGESLGPMVS